ncbi:MAG: SPOR domain-containing protein, partial [Polynucleobacter victoriensis]
GAIFLVTVAVAGLPIIFDSKPKQYNNDIAIQIIQPGAKEEKKSDAKPEEARTETAAANKDTKKEESKSDKPAPVAKTLDKGEEVLSILEDRKSTPAANTGHSGKYIVQIGAFASEDRVKNWQKKLNEQKVSTYVDVRPGKDGGKLHLLRSGPYGDRAAAEAAEKKIKYVGLSPKIIEQKSE